MVLPSPSRAFDICRKYIPLSALANVLLWQCCARYLSRSSPVEAFALHETTCKNGRNACTPAGSLHKELGFTNDTGVLVMLIES